MCAFNFFCVSVSVFVFMYLFLCGFVPVSLCLSSNLSHPLYVCPSICYYLLDYQFNLFLFILDFLFHVLLVCIQVCLCLHPSIHLSVCVSLTYLLILNVSNNVLSTISHSLHTKNCLCIQTCVISPSQCLSSSPTPLCTQDTMGQKAKICARGRQQCDRKWYKG